MPERLRIFYTADIHGSGRCFRKFLNAAAVYKADVIILGGDLTGKIVVPVLARPDGSFEARIFGQRHYGSNPEQLAKLERELAVSGVYAQSVGANELQEAVRDPMRRQEIFLRAMRQTVEEWIALAEERLRGTGVECYIMPGNDDHPSIDEILSRSPRIINPDNRIVTVGGRYEMLSLGVSNKTPFESPRELEEREIGSILEKLVGQIKNKGSAIFNLHCPPYGSGLDLAPEVDENLRIVSYGGQPHFIPVGSRAVRSCIEDYQPLLGVHGHIHESRGVGTIGRTTCLNPGSEYGQGILHGVIIVVEGSRIRSYQFVSG